MVRKIEVIVPFEREDDVLSLLTEMRDVHGLFKVVGADGVQMTFRASEKKSGNIIDSLGKMGVGVDFGSVDISNLQMTKPRISNRRKNDPKRDYRIDDRMTVEEIHQFIDSNLHLTFDYLAFTCVAAIIAASGLLTNSSVVVVASMLVSPLMGPIMGMTFGTTIAEWPMFRKGLKNEAIGMLLTLFIGVIAGLVVLPFQVHEWVTEEILSRGRWSILIGGFAIATASGAGVALSCTNGGISALVGVAISASLLPPIVNCGITFVWSIAYRNGMEADKGTDFADIIFRTSVVSFLLFLMNWFLIYVVALLVFRLKKVKRNVGAYDRWQERRRSQSELPNHVPVTPSTLGSLNTSSSHYETVV